MTALAIWDLEAIVANVRYKDWAFVVTADTLQVRFGGLTGRKWRLSKWMTKSEVVQTALLAVLAAEEHEAREHFLYRGEAIFGPHYDVEALVDLKRTSAPDTRQAIEGVAV